MLYGRYNTGVRSAKGGDRERHAVEIADGPVTINGITALKHDICEGAVPLFHEADCIYSEIAWKAGYEAFTDGTEAEGSSHGDYLAGMLSCIYELKVPTLIVCGKREARVLRPHAQKPVRFTYHHCPAVLAAWYTDIPEEIATDTDARDWIIASHECVLDPCCGFGNTARVAVCMGRRGIMADVDTECVSYMQKGLYI